MRGGARLAPLARAGYGPAVQRLALSVLVVTSTSMSLPASAAKKAADTTPPTIAHTPLPQCPTSGPCAVRAQITDPSGVFDPTLLFRLHGTQAFDRVAMKAVAGEKDVYEGVVPAALVGAGDVDYLIEAFDVEGNGPARAGTEQAPLMVSRPPPEAPPPPPPPPPPPVVVEEDNTGLIVGVVVAGVAAVAVAAVGVGVAVYALRPPAPESINVVVKGPTPFAGVR